MPLGHSNTKKRKHQEEEDDNSDSESEEEEESSESEEEAPSVVVGGKGKAAMPLGHSNTKKRKHQEGSESEEDDNSDSESEEEEESSESEEEAPSMDMPQTGHKISRLKCEETKGRARAWWAFFCEPEYRQWCKLDAAPNERALRKVVTACRSNPGKEQSLAKGSADANSAMLGSRTDGVAYGSPQRAGSLYQTNGYCSSNAFLLGVSSLTKAQRCGLIAGSKSHMMDGEFAKLVNDTTGLHLVRYVERLDTYEEFNRAILMRGGQYMASPIMKDGTESHHIFIDVDRQVVHDPAHPSAEAGSGIPMDSRGWTKELGDWETWNVCDVREVVANVSLYDMVACNVCNSAFQPAKAVQYCRNNQATHENGKRHKAAIRALQIK